MTSAHVVMVSPMVMFLKHSPSSLDVGWIPQLMNGTGTVKA
jgi:hypothetical protein